MPAVFTWVRGGSVGWGTAVQAERLWIRFPIRSLEFLIDINLPATLWPQGWLTLRGKGGRCEGLATLPRSWNLETLISWNPQGLSRPLPLPWPWYTSTLLYWFHDVGTENFTLLVYVFFTTSILMRSALFCDITQCGVVILYRRFGTIHPSHLQSSRSPRIFHFNVILRFFPQEVFVSKFLNSYIQNRPHMYSPL